MADMSGITAQMAGIIPVTVVAGVAIKTTQAVFGDNPMSQRRRKRNTSRRKSSRRRSGHNAFGGTSPI